MTFNGKQFEELILYRARADEKKGLYSMGRCGVMSSFRDGQWHPIPSLPDFEGIRPPDGRAFFFDAKTCSQASYDLTGGTSHSFEHQYKFMRRRARFGALCFLLMHFNERVLKTRADESLTVLFPVDDTPFWRGYDRGEQKGITRNEARLYGIPVEWDLIGSRTKTETPNLLKAIEMAEEAKAHGET